MRRLLSCLMFVAPLFCVTPDALAIATSNNTISAENPAGHGYELDWGYIYKYKNSSSVAVDHYWILTAAHVADDGGTGNLIVEGETYTQQEVIFHSTADLALVRYDKPFPGYYALYEGEIHNGKNGGARVYDPLVMVGYGFPGTVAATSFTQSGSAGTKRWGTNRGEGETAVSLNVGGTVGDATTQCFSMTFNLSDTDHEAGGNVFDSGGPVFIERDSSWKLTGVNLYRAGANPYTGNYAAMVHDYIGWIKSVIVDYDTDMDGLPDWWELQYGGDEMSMDASGDLDSDGYTNLDEWYSDTDPTNGVSFLDVDYVPPASVRISNGSVDRAYQIQRRTDLANTNATWQVDLDWFDGTGTQMVQAVTSTPSNGFYRVRARLP